MLHDVSENQFRVWTWLSNTLVAFMKASSDNPTTDIPRRGNSTLFAFQILVIEFWASVLWGIKVELSTSFNGLVIHSQSHSVIQNTGSVKSKGINWRWTMRFNITAWLCSLMPIIRWHLSHDIWAWQLRLIASFKRHYPLFGSYFSFPAIPTLPLFTLLYCIVLLTPKPGCCVVSDKTLLLISITSPRVLILHL